MGARPWSARCIRDSLPMYEGGREDELPAHQPMLCYAAGRSNKITCHAQPRRSLHVTTPKPMQGCTRLCAVGAPQCGHHTMHTWAVIKPLILKADYITYPALR